jgi:hypothetical protein
MAADFKLEAIFEFINRGSRDIQRAEEDVGRLERAVETAGDVIKGYLTVEAGKAVYELGKMGAQALRTESAFEAISGGADEASKRLEAMQTATRGALSEQEAMGAANQLMQMGLANTAGELQNVTEMAVTLGTAMGRDASASIDEFAMLLANQSIPRLDTFGISAGKVRTRIKELQEQVEGLSREQAFLQAVQEEGAKAMGRLEGATDEEALAFERLEAKTKDLKVALAKELAPALATAADAGLLLLEWNDKIDQALDEQTNRVTRTASSYEDYVEGVLDARVAARKMASTMRDEAVESLSEQDEYAQE